MKQSVPKSRQIKFRRREITQKKKKIQCLQLSTVEVRSHISVRRLLSCQAAGGNTRQLLRAQYNSTMISVCPCFLVFNIYLFPKIPPGINRIQRCDFHQIQLSLWTYPIHVSSHMLENICLYWNTKLTSKNLSLFRFMVSLSFEVSSTRDLCGYVIRYSSSNNKNINLFSLLLT